MAYRTAGTRWRILVHERLSRRGPDGIRFGTSHSIGSSERLAGKEREHVKVTVLPGTEFDELVLGRFLHLEQMNATVYWMNVAGININVTADRDGRPRYVTVEPPDESEWPGCVYRYED